MISVCMTTYNGEKYLEDQLRSILEQIGPDDEVIISDDGSTDGTIKIIESLNDSRIKLFFNYGKHGFTHNFENALMHANGDTIFLSDQDDIWKENKVQVTLNYLQDCDLTISDCTTVNDKMEVLQESRFDAFHIKEGFVRHLIKSRYLGCCMAFNNRLLEAVLPFPKDESLLEHDIWIAAVGFLYFKTRLIREPLVMYRRHSNNVSDGGFDKGYPLANKVYRRIYRLKSLASIRGKVKKIRGGGVKLHNYAILLTSGGIA